jgi:hypothetical protein
LLNHSKQDRKVVGITLVTTNHHMIIKVLWKKYSEVTTEKFYEGPEFVPFIANKELSCRTTLKRILYIL